MINIPKNRITFPLVTPEWAKEYLQKKPQFLATWKKLIPHYFTTADEFCKLINEVRIKRIEKGDKINQEILALQKKEQLLPQENQRLNSLQEQKKTIFIDIRKEIFGPLLLSKMKNKDIRYETNQLIWSLAGSLKTPKEHIQEFTEIVNQEVYEDLSRMETYEHDFAVLIENHIDQYITDKGIGPISEGERKEIGQQMWNNFINLHQEDLEKYKIDAHKLNRYFHIKNLI